MSAYPQLTTASSVSVTETYWPWKRGKIRVWETDPHPSGRAIVLLHGYGAMIEHWRRAIPKLASAATVYALDLLGFGWSDKPAIDYAASVWVEQTADFIKTRNLSKPVICGHSMGGMVAGRVAHDHPDLTGGLVLVDAAGLPPKGEPSFIERAIGFAVRTPWLGEAAFSLLGNETGARQGLEASYFDQSFITDDLVRLFAAPLQMPGAVTSYLAVSRNFKKFLLDIPNGIAAPTLIVWGERDRSLPVSLVDEFQSMIPQAERCIIPDTGHCPQDESSDAFSAAVVRFLESRA